ncbi:MAG TPA: SDR family NAD(P)-dependent oxidoreductase [Acidimicrobiales bacterium]|jgi:NAD(P)-dependent dehydrogenase (short-subunit alcohol dehydrogenase family)|nr:SDR family NAD(P)-dependent oxidoreductase [Acidimicrobiales bacterium]
MRFEGRVAIVTGAASGIGRATAERLADEGATVVPVDVAKDELGVGGIVGDVSDPTFAPSLVAQTIERHGRLDVLANVAGILRTANTHEHSLEVWDQVLAVNLTGTFLCCRAAIPELLKSGGNIVNVSSTAALSGHPWAAAYSASKGGVLALTRTIAVEYAQQGLRCNAVCPGSIKTPITKDFEFPEGVNMDLVRRLMALDKPRGPETVAAAIAFLASDDAAHVNGEDVRVDGATLS